jgi:hypothetical protein
MAHPMAGCGVGKLLAQQEWHTCFKCSSTFISSDSLQEGAACSILHVCICLGVRTEVTGNQPRASGWAVHASVLLGNLGRKNGMPVMHIAPASLVS